MAMIQKYTAKENQSLFEDGARTRRTAGAKCVVAIFFLFPSKEFPLISFKKLSACCVTLVAPLHILCVQY
jgi:hypothetical protein